MFIHRALFFFTSLSFSPVHAPQQQDKPANAPIRWAINKQEASVTLPVLSCGQCAISGEPQTLSEFMCKLTSMVIGNVRL